VQSLGSDGRIAVYGSVGHAINANEMYKSEEFVQHLNTHINIANYLSLKVDGEAKLRGTTVTADIIRASF
jgi:hypothetical protein